MPQPEKDKPMAINAAIMWDNVGGNDPEVAMSACLFVAKAYHILTLFI